MTAVFCCLLFPPSLAAAQTNFTAVRGRAANIDATSVSLLQLNTAGSARGVIQRQIAETMISSAEADQQPSRSTVGRFLDELTARFPAESCNGPKPLRSRSAWWTWFGRPAFQLCWSQFERETC